MSSTHPLLYVRDAQDACKVLEAVRRGMLPLWTRRLNPGERQSIQPGNIFVWEEAEEKGGLERWTDGRRWTQSRMRLDFLFYEETLPLNDDEKLNKRRNQSPEISSPSPSSSRRHERPLKPNGLAKQTISMIVNDRGESKRWHLVAYTSLDDRRYPIPLIDQYDYLRGLKVPDGVFLTTRGYTWNKKPMDNSPDYPYSSDNGYSPTSPSFPSKPLINSQRSSGYQMAGASSPKVVPSLWSSSYSRDSRHPSINTNVTCKSKTSPYSPMTPEDRKVLDSFPLRL